MSKFDKLKKITNPVGALDLINEDRAVTKLEVKKEKIKRSFMLTENQIRLLNNMKVNHRNVNITLSDIVGLAIEEYNKIMNNL